MTTPGADARWTFHARRGSMERTTPLRLVYEVDGTPMSDDYESAEIDAAELFRRWATRYVVGDGYVSVAWFVAGEATFEAAPFCGMTGDFLTHYSWPASAGERLNWNRLPVEDGAWSEGAMTKGGFFQEHTGFKPAPFTTRLHVPTILRRAGFGAP